MDFEKMERTMQFILEQQAGYAAWRGESEAWRAESEARAKRMERTMEFILDQQAQISVTIQKFGEQLARVSADTVSLDKENEARMEEIDAQGAEIIELKNGILAARDASVRENEARLKEIQAQGAEIIELKNSILAARDASAKENEARMKEIDALRDAMTGQNRNGGQ